MADYEDPETLLQLAQPDPVFLEALQDFLKAPQPKDATDIEVMRQGRRIEDQKRIDALPEFPDVSVTTKSISMRDGHMSEIRIFTPTVPPSSKGRPLVVLIYGGGFVHGDNQSTAPYSLPIVSVYNAVVVNITYRLAPEFKFPIQGNDVWDTLQWLDSNAKSLGADLSAGFVLGGESAGGNLAAVTAVKAVSKSLPSGAKLTGAWLSIPWLLDAAPKGYEDTYLARDQNKSAAIINAELLERIKEIWRPDVSSPEFSPFNSLELVNDQHPPTYIQVCGMDPLRDDGLIYERVLREKGVETLVDVYPGVTHAHWAMFPFLEISRKSMVDSILGLGWLLGKMVPVEDIEESLGKLAADI